MVAPNMMHKGDGVTRERSIGELFGDLASETSTLVRQEVQLAKTEMTQKATFVGKQVGVIAVGALLGVVALITLSGALVLLLGEVMPLWASALLVTAVLGLAAYLFAMKGINTIKHADLKPNHTIASLQDNKSWAQKQLQ